MAKQYTAAEKAEYYARLAEKEKRLEEEGSSGKKMFTWEHLVMAFFLGLVIGVVFL